MANSSGGKSDFVQEGDYICEKVIPQLQSSLHPGLSSIEIHFEGEESNAFEVSSFPLPSVNESGSFVIYLRARKSEKSRSTFENGILVTGGYGENTVEVPVQEIFTLEEVEEDELGCSSGRNVSKAILPLFAFSVLQKYGEMPQISNSEREKAIELSLSSGVLGKFAALVGMAETKEKIYSGELFKYVVHGRTKQTARRSTDGCAPRKSPDAKMTPTTNESEESMQYNLLTITRFQKFEGFWEDLEAVQKLAGLSVNRIDEVSVSDKNVENNCIATILAVAGQ